MMDEAVRIAAVVGLWDMSATGAILRQGQTGLR